LEPVPPALTGLTCVHLSKSPFPSLPPAGFLGRSLPSLQPCITAILQEKFNRLLAAACVFGWPFCAPRYGGFLFNKSLLSDAHQPFYGNGARCDRFPLPLLKLSANCCSPGVAPFFCLNVFFSPLCRDKGPTVRLLHTSGMFPTLFFFISGVNLTPGFVVLLT